MTRNKETLIWVEIQCYPKVAYSFPIGKQRSSREACQQPAESGE